jgi:hypothetical protein
MTDGPIQICTWRRSELNSDEHQKKKTQVKRLVTQLDIVRHVLL